MTPDEALDCLRDPTSSGATLDAFVMGGVFGEACGGCSSRMRPGYLVYVKSMPIDDVQRANLYLCVPCAWPHIANCLARLA